MKLSDIPSPRDFEVSYGIRGIYIPIPGAKRYYELMQHLEKLGWVWASGRKPTDSDRDYHPYIKYICIDFMGIFSCYSVPSDYDLFEIDDWGEQPSVALAVAPRNNDNRTTCYWCGAPCKQVQGIVNTYIVCIGCGK